MAEETAGEKTFAPTQKRREDAAKNGDVLRSREFATFAATGTGALALWAFGAWISEGLAAIVRKPISGARLREVFADIGVGFVDLAGVRLATIGNRTEELVRACSTLVRAGCQSPEQVVVGGLPADDCQVALLDLGEHPQASGWLRELAERRPRLTIVGLHDEGVAPVVSTADVVTVTRSLVAESPGRVVRLVAGWLSEQKTREAE